MMWFIQMVAVLNGHYSAVYFWRDEITPSKEVDWKLSAFVPDIGSASLYKDREEAEKRISGIFENILHRHIPGDLMICAFDPAWSPAMQIFGKQKSN